MRTNILRLKTASMPELLYRLKQLLVVLRARYPMQGGRAGPIPKVDPADIEQLKMPGLHPRSCLENIDSILAGGTFTLNMEKSVQERFERYSKNLFFSDIRIAGRIPDIRPVWEPARLQHITILIAAIVNEPRSPALQPAREFAKNAVLKWIAENPFLRGPHYISAMECGLRIPVFCYALRVLDWNHDERASICGAIYLHAWWIFRRLSLYSSLGNHTIGECVGLIFAGAVFRNHREGSGWFEAGMRLLEKELFHQVLEDGGPVEQSFQYLRFILDLYWLSIDFVEKNGFCNCESLKERLLAGESFLAAFQDQCCDPPSIGDSDDGFAVAPGLAPERREPKKEIGVRVFDKSGYTVIHGQNGVLLTFDHGPLGMPPFYNHGHADALSITLCSRGEPILVDPGTYRYNGEHLYRQYFKGTRAHNTVTIDGLDQAVQETGFIWGRPFTAKLLGASETAEGGFVLDAVHNGYSRLTEGPVHHGRSIYFLDRLHFLCVDRFSGSGTHSFELNFHLHPDVRISREKGWWAIEKGAAKIFLMLLGAGGFRFVTGEEDPPFGWFSASYGAKKRSGVLTSVRSGLPCDVCFVTLICTEKIPANFEKGAVKCIGIPALESWMSGLTL